MSVALQLEVLARGIECRTAVQAKQLQQRALVSSMVGMNIR